MSFKYDKSNLFKEFEVAKNKDIVFKTRYARRKRE